MSAEGTISIGAFPSRRDTVRAKVLACLLLGEQQTSMDGVLKESTTRLASQIHMLRHKYGWPVLTEEIQVPTADGRIADVARYSLSALVIEAAQRAGAETFILEVMEARSKLRRLGTEQRQAARSPDPT